MLQADCGNYKWITPDMTSDSLKVVSTQASQEAFDHVITRVVSYAGTPIEAHTNFVIITANEQKYLKR